MGRMWKYEPEDYGTGGGNGGDGGGKDHLKGQQFKYKTPTTIDYETDNDGNPIFPEPTMTQGQGIARVEMAKRALKGEHKFK